MIVYEAMFPNGKRYIGITTKSLKEREAQHRHHSKYTKSKSNSGERNGKSKLDWETVMKMREEYNTGQYTQRELAKKYNITFGHMSQILNNKRWRE